VKMKTTFTYTTILTTLLALGSVASGQSYGGTSAQPSPSLAYAPGFYPGRGYGQDSYSSSYEEGVLSGLGSLASAYGQANFMNSLAAVNMQDAYARYLQNAERSTETYFRMQQINKAAREANRPQRLSYDQYVAMAKKYAPDGLSEYQYDRTLGRLNWPAVLTSEEFAAEREALNRAFMVRSPTDAGAASAFHSNVRRITDSMNAKLRAEFDQLGTAEYLAAKKFITGLEWESQQPLVVRALAAR
jgi:hypothetical protein